jgi:serine phosphatase RsbU (regulator of sigma subunit)/integral membrane sensor domain MASE1/anti-sigma regulatory factor (Ser/Thr protein kinase)
LDLRQSLEGRPVLGRHGWLYAAKVVGVAAAYYGSAKLGLGLAFETTSVTAVWPPTGIALAAVVLCGYRIWPAVALGAVLANGWTGVPLYTVLGITVGNTLEALAGAYLLRRFGGFRPSLERVRDVIALVALAGVLSTTISATFGVTSLLAADEISGAQFGSVWRTWWLGDLGGDLVVAPALLVAATHWPFNRAPGRPLEAAALAAVLVTIGLLVFSTATPLIYLIFPPLIWAALRFWQPGAAAASLLVAGVAIPFSEGDLGPFAGNPPDERLLLAQTFVGVAGMTALVLAAIITERARVEDTVEYIADTLQESLLPARLPEIPGVEAAVEFRPAGERHVVGGDFYDVFQGDDGSWAVVVGDVCGKGAAAAAVTGLARYTLRAAAIQEDRPSRVLELLNDAILRQRAPSEFCSAAFARLEPNGVSGARATLASGGHPLPLVLRSDGSVEAIGAHGTLLGVVQNPALSDATVELRPGDALVLYTDGLTDAYAPERIVTQADLAAALAACAGRPAAQIAREVAGAALGNSEAQPRDDIALLVLGIPAAARAAPDKQIVVRLPGEAGAVPLARQAIDELEPELEPALFATVRLLVSELVSNSIRHAHTPAAASVALHVTVFADRMRVEVGDHGPGFNPRRRAPDRDGESGWGLYLVDQLSDRWGVSGTSGTSVWFEIDRRPDRTDRGARRPSRSAGGAPGRAGRPLGGR